MPLTANLPDDSTLPQRSILAQERLGPTRGFCPGLLPGPTQTEDYARAVIEACAPGIDSTALRQAVAVRMERNQALLDETGPPRTYIITDLSLTCGRLDEAEMGAQLDHLRSVAGLAHVDLRLLPPAATEPWTTGFILLGGHAHIEGPSELIKLPLDATPTYDAHFERLVASSSSLMRSSF
jgi:hypothetical protein